MFNKNRIIPDHILTRFTPLDVESLFRSINSPLAGYKVNGTLVSTLVGDACKQANVDPRFIITKLQVEQSLLYSTPTKEKLDWALGYGCPDNGPWNEEYRGIAKQITAAAHGIKGYLDPNNSFYVGNKVNKPWQVSDGTVTCSNIATAALYRYTPWIGDCDAGGNRSPFGNFLFYKVWTALFGPISFEDTPQTPATPSGTSSPPATSPDPSHPSTSTWRIITPPDNWRAPLTVIESELSKIETIARTLNLRFTRDETRKKFYLGLPLAQSPQPHPNANIITYPSGEALPIADETPWKAEHSTYWAPHPEVSAPLIKVEHQLLNKNLSIHFTLNEFVCGDPRYDHVRISPKLIEKLEQIRTKAGNYPIHITSSYRPYPYNTTLDGAATQSYHIDGVAADIYINELTTTQLASICNEIIGDSGGVGIYLASGFVHVDVRGYRARW